MSLKEVIKEAADKFSDAVMEAVQGHLREVVGAAVAGALDGEDEAPAPVRRGRPARAASPKTKAAKKASPKAKASKGGRLARRSPEEIAAAVATVAKVLAKHPDGLRAEQIREATDLSPKELPRVLKQGVADKVIHIASGQKRSTTYAAGSKRGGGSSAKPKKAKKAARKAAKASGKGKAPKAKAKPAKTARKAKKASTKGKALNGAAEASPATA
jgi:hypothetical protein